MLECLSENPDERPTAQQVGLAWSVVQPSRLRLHCGMAAIAVQSSLACHCTGCKQLCCLPNCMRYHLGQPAAHPTY